MQAARTVESVVERIDESDNLDVGEALAERGLMLLQRAGVRGRLLPHIEGPSPRPRVCQDAAAESAANDHHIS